MKNLFSLFTVGQNNNSKHLSLLKTVSLTLGAGVLAVSALHVITEIFVRVRHLCFETRKPLCERFEGKSTSPPKVIITGGLQGLGFELVLKFLSLGYQIQIWDLKQEIENEEKRNIFFSGLKINGESSSNVLNLVELVAVDVSDIEQVKLACSNFLERNNGNGPDLLILNAGVVARKLIGQFEPGEIQKCFATNVSVHAFEILNMMLPKMLSMMKENQPLPWRRSIVLISSITSFSGFAHASEYCATKAALVSLGDSLRSEIRTLQKQNDVDVLTVCPYLIGTRMFQWCRPPFWFFSALDPKWVAGKIVNDGIRYRRSCLVLPWFFNLMPIVKWVLPEWCWLIADDVLDASSWLKPPEMK